MLEMFQPNSFASSTIHDLGELVARQLNLLYTRVIENNEQAKAEAMVTLAIHLQQTTINADFLEGVYLKISDSDGIWIDEGPFFELLGSLIDEQGLSHELNSRVAID